MLFWSSRWREYNTESFRDLRKVVNRSVDPLYPDGVPIISKKAGDSGQNRHQLQQQLLQQKQEQEQEQQEQQQQEQSLLNLPRESTQAEHKDGLDPLYSGEDQSTTSSQKAASPHSSGNAE
jgi:hypothetical protein